MIRPASSEHNLAVVMNILLAIANGIFVDLKNRDTRDFMPTATIYSIHLWLVLISIFILGQHLTHFDACGL